ncbi:hypothetical protein TrLO_g777 [Triparma laevis f. longispina]|uniref:Uncharacterized protein n=1 Tax=Triparma laevis f. longispina TaxID=1714387 RepID=A0A9W7F185_9STRA|nr:hypothetical protein TrLO_g777 [Triparma laevis f. longispina]
MPHKRDNFMATDDFRRLLRGYIDVADLFHTFRLVSKLWQRIAEEKIDGDFRSGGLAFHDGKGISGQEAVARQERRKLSTDNFTQMPEFYRHFLDYLAVCTLMSMRLWAKNLVIVENPEGVERIGDGAFVRCFSLITVLSRRR